ncbi:unnamed protein product [Heligmosomoides polygyrus]|uniref:RNA-dependent RNA polymerase n=1 Tax=Heligmosomoides polygyrus TaxID=6339 RepID=A0A183F7N1_HELPZ|nr:unnamed protein product [Heligmosomoides polygyrus]
MIDERKRIGSIMMAFMNEFRSARAHGGRSTLTKEEARDGYLKVRKLVITQTRVIYVVPEMMMGNRVLREKDHDGTRIIRVTFRDDDSQAMRTSKTSKELIENTLREFLKYGIIVADRDFGYVGSSNSQMRDSGAYFMEKCSKHDRDEYRKRHNKDPPRLFQPKIDDLRRDLGRFEEMESIPKLMARLGQCFTQSKVRVMVFAVLVRSKSSSRGLGQ